MALHGEVKVNGMVIAYWSAQRLDDLEDEAQTSLYYASYEESDNAQGRFWRADYVESAVLEHRYIDGAAELAAKVLTLAEGGW